MPIELSLLWQICSALCDCLWSTCCILGGCSDHPGAVQEKDEEREDDEENGGQSQIDAHQKWI